MAILWCDGLETLGVDGGDPVDATFNRRYFSNDPEDIRIDNGRFTTGSSTERLAFSLQDVGSGFVMYAGPRYGPYDSDTTKIWGFSQRFPNALSSAYYMIRWVTDTGLWSIGIKGFPDGAAALYDGSGSLISVSEPGFLVTRGWNRVEAKVYAHASAGTFELWVNGEQCLNLSGLNTITAASGTYHARAFLYSQSSVAAASTRFDDIYVCNTSGSTHNDFVGDFTSLASFPTGDDTTEWTPSTGNAHYALVDEAEPDDDTTYVDSDTVNDVDKFTTTNLTSIDSVLAVVLGVDARLVDAGDRSYRSILDSGGTEYAGQTVPLTDTTWVYTFDIWEQDPDTSLAWTVNGYNATKPGVEVVS